MNRVLTVPERIETERLILRRHRMDDLDAFLQFLMDPSATRYLAFTQEQKTREGARGLLRFAIDSYSTQTPLCSLTIADRKSDEYLGSCGANPDGDEIEIYYTVLPVHQGKGIATEASKALVGYLRSITASRLAAYVIPENLPSVRVAEKLGFIDSGPVERTASTRGVEFEILTGRKYVLDRSSKS